jgi:hypothetical protein
MGGEKGNILIDFLVRTSPPQAINYISTLIKIR